jgi:isoquinoline 1-oxidoreductase beta subunit
LRAGLDAAGGLVAWHHRIAGSAVRGFARGDWQDEYARDECAGAFDLPYRIPNWLVEYVDVPTRVPRGVWRSVAASANNFAVQTLLDAIARETGEDPLQLRLELIGEPRRIPYPPPDQAFFLDSGRARRVLQLLAEKAGWGRPAPAGRARGLAIGDGGGATVAHVAEVSIQAGALVVHRVVSAVECGVVVHPDGVRAQVEGGIAFGLSAALFGRIAIREGAVEQGGFRDYPLLTMAQMPEVEVHIVPSQALPDGVGEPPVPPIAPAVANALLALTGRAPRRLPIRLEQL